MADEVSVLSEKLLLDAKVIALQLGSILVRAPERGKDLQQQLMEILAGDAPSASVGAAGSRSGPDDIEALIHEFLAESNEPQSVEQIYQLVQESYADIRKPSLNVKLHRMATAGVIVKAYHGHYTVSELERRRARTGGR